MKAVQITGLCKRFGSVTAVENLSFQAEPGELVSILGPSGCGKTTTLKIIAGLQKADGGTVWIGDRDIGADPPEQRSAVMVFQRPLLFPFMSVGENVAFGLRMRRESRPEVARRVAEILDMVQLSGLEHRRPSELSGGQQQRVALARALVLRPDVLLLDEPLSNLDASLRDEMRDLVRRVHAGAGVTTIFVTHDQQEATLLSDRIALMFEGRLHQFDTPRMLYDKPKNLRVSAFFGNRNCFAGTKRGTEVHTAMGIFRHEAGGLPDGPVYLVIRPEALRLERQNFNMVDGVLTSHLYLGTHSRCRVQVGQEVVEMVGDAGLGGEINMRLSLFLPPDRIWLVPRLEENGRHQAGATDLAAKEAHSGKA